MKLQDILYKNKLTESDKLYLKRYIGRLEESVFTFDLLEEENPQAKVKALRKKRSALRVKFIRLLRSGGHAALLLAEGVLGIFTATLNELNRILVYAYFKSKSIIITRNPGIKQLIMKQGKAYRENLTIDTDIVINSMQKSLFSAQANFYKSKGDLAKANKYKDLVKGNLTALVILKEKQWENEREIKSTQVLIDIFLSKNTPNKFKVAPRK